MTDLMVENICVTVVVIALMVFWYYLLKSEG
jgi:hypothetical protein